jgi:hypothetical protein
MRRFGHLVRAEVDRADDDDTAHAIAKCALAAVSKRHIAEERFSPPHSV